MNHLDTLREFYAESRRLVDDRATTFDESNAAHRALGERLVAWADTIDTAMSPKSLEEAVVGAYACVIKHCKQMEMCPGWETFCKPPECQVLEGRGQWRVCWESGPDGWGIEGSVVPVRYRSGSDWYTEPYFSFDLCFVRD